MIEDARAILEGVKEAAAKRILFLPHAVNQMNAPERMISSQEVRSVIFHGVVIQDYPEDVRGQQLSAARTRRWRSSDSRCVCAKA